MIKNKKKLSLVTENLLLLLPGPLLLGLIITGFHGLSSPLGLLRLFLGLFYVLFVPGYTLITGLFPRADSLTGIVRLALSISLSVALIPLFTLLLDYLPWGIRLWPLLIAEAGLILVFSLVAWYRRSQLPQSERFLLSLDLDLKAWWHAQDKVNRIVYFCLLGVIAVALSSAVALLLIPKPGEYFTELYIVGPEGMIENYPREALVGEPVTVTIGITNLESEAHNYRLEVWVSDPMGQGRRLLTAEIAPFTLSVGQTFEYPLSWTMPWPGGDQKVEFFLYIDEDPGPYRWLNLWMDVTATDG